MKKLITLILMVFSNIIISYAQDFELVPYREIDKWGFVDSNKNIKISPQYDDVIPFNFGYSAFKKGDKWGFLNNLGNEILKPTYDSVINYFDLVNDFMNDGIVGIKVVLRGEKLIVDKEGRIIEEEDINFDMYVFSDYESGPIVFQENGLYGVKENNTSKVLVKPQYENLILIGRHGCHFKLNNKWGYLNEDFEVIINNIYDSIFYVFRGGFVVELNEKFGMINNDNEIILPIIYKNISETGFYLFNNKNKMGYVNNEGQIIIEPIYDDIIIYSRLKYAFSIKINNKWGYHNIDDEFYIKPKYNSIQQFKNGYALVTDSKGEKGYINTKGIEFFK